MTACMATVSNFHSRNLHARLEGTMEVVVSREVHGLLRCGDKVYESSSPGNDVIQVIHSTLEFIVKAS